MLAAVLAVGGLLGWLAASGRMGELYAQQTKPQPASAEGTQLPKPDPAFKGKIGEGLDIGTDLGSAVGFTYKLPFTFTGKIEKVTFDLK
jgi:hypothetical protein